MDNILVVNVNWVGDVIFSSPVFKALKKKYPRAKVSCLAVPRVRGVCESIPAIDEVVVYDERGRDRFLFGKWRVVQRLRKGKYDAVFLLHRSWTRAFLCYLAGIPVRVGEPSKNRGKFLTHHVKALKGNAHRMDHYLNVIESFGLKVGDRSNELRLSHETEGQVKKILEQHGVKSQDLKIICHVGANWDLKKWPMENFSKLLDCLAEEFDAKIIIPGEKGDASLIDAIVSRVKCTPVILAGKTDLKQLMGLMKCADYVISADSGPLHMASSVGTKAIAIFGPTRPELTGPRGQGETLILQKDVGCNRQACYYLQCLDNICMKAVNVKEVIDAVRQFQNK